MRVGRGLGTLPAPNAAESLALQRIHAEPNVRLACQLRPVRDLHITPLLPADAGAADANGAGTGGRERAVAVMFVDLRDSSRLAEHRLPYDVLFILNRFFAEMADALRETGGYYSTFNGDGFMALYGTTSDLAQGCRDALHGAIAVSGRLAQINAALTSELREPLRVGISVHAGEAIVGTMGPPAHPIVSALGDTVNVASRLESETKRHQCALVVSAVVREGCRHRSVRLSRAHGPGARAGPERQLLRDCRRGGVDAAARTACRASRRRAHPWREQRGRGVVVRRSSVRLPCPTGSVARPLAR